MYKHLIFIFAFFVTVAASSQVQPTATGDMLPVDDDTQMAIPPLASALLYPTTSTGDERSNYLNGSVTATEAYTDNILPSATSVPVADETTSLRPNLSFNWKTPRQLETFTYSPSFTFYKTATSLNTWDQNATEIYQGRLSPHITLGLQDNFVKTSNVFNTGYPFAAGGLSGLAQSPTPPLIVPYADQLRNTANIDLTYQYTRQGMIGAGGQFSIYRFPNHAQSPGLYDSGSIGASVFFNRRLTRGQYLGAMYQYYDTLTYVTPYDIDTQVHEILPFYTLTLHRSFSLSIAGGAQRIFAAQHPQTLFKTWAPEGVFSLGWQGERGHIAASFLHKVIAGEGLTGAYNSNSANFLGGWRFARTWTGETSVSYQQVDVVAWLPLSIYPDGHMFGASATVQHSFGDRMNLQFGYDRLQEKYAGLAVIGMNPSSNREFLTLTYTFTKALGR